MVFFLREKLRCVIKIIAYIFAIRWYRDGSIHAMEAEVIAGKTRAEPTVAILTLEPNRDDDGATFRCVVRNRAMREGQQLEATVELSVNCKYFVFVL